MLLCPESEQFNPGKVFMFFRKQENYGIFAASDGKFTAAAYIVSNHIAQLQLSNIFPFTP